MTYLKESDLEKVAEVYSAALDAGEYPVLAVAKELGIPRTTAGKRVTFARLAGLLPPTTKGVATGRNGRVR